MVYPTQPSPLLEDEGVSRSDAHAYAEGVMRGGTVIIVSCADHEIDQVVGILGNEGVLDIDEKQTSWRSEGWQESAGKEIGGLAGPYDSAQTGMDSGEDLTGCPDMTQARSDMGTHVNVDKGSSVRIRVHSRKIEHPVQK